MADPRNGGPKSPNRGGDICSWCFLDRGHLVLQEKAIMGQRESSTTALVM